MIKFRYKRKEPTGSQQEINSNNSNSANNQNKSNNASNPSKSEKTATIKRANSSNSILLSRNERDEMQACDNALSLASCINSVVVSFFRIDYNCFRLRKSFTFKYAINI